MSFKTEELAIDLLERVLMRLGLSNRPAPTLDGLQTLYAAWCRKVPFDLDCRLDHLYVTRETFQERHEQTRPWSPFNYELYARLICGDAVVGTTGGQRVELSSAGDVIHKRLEGDDRIRLLVDELGMKEEIVQRLPFDTPTPPPPWSRTARNAS
jgi:hypothetical protein